MPHWDRLLLPLESFVEWNVNLVAFSLVIIPALHPPWLWEKYVSAFFKLTVHDQFHQCPCGVLHCEESYPFGLLWSLLGLGTGLR